uniref:F-box protein n=1 Tax=Quercus lobata TaxID=97700 RepID=A0A7N2N692_QUELO
MTSSKRRKESGMTGLWSGLPADLLSLIVDRLGLIELLSFHGVCKAWRAAASTALSKIEASANLKPWFLIYGENSQCHLYNESGRRYTTSIPELDGATCIASHQGWILVFQGGTMFFYCPFSHAKIDIPTFPLSVLSNHAAAFSSPPTTRECIVAVMHRDIMSGFSLYVLQRGANAWAKCELIQFYNHTLLKNENSTTIKHLPYVRSKSHFVRRNMKKRLGLGEDVSISICGTVVQNDSTDIIICNEEVESAEEFESCYLKGYAEKFQCIRDATFIAVTWQVAVAEHISLLNQQAFYSNQERPELYISKNVSISRALLAQSFYRLLSTQTGRLFMTA